MTMKPWATKLALTAHVTTSVGWFGALLAYLALAVVGATSQDAQLVRAVYVAAEPMTSYVIVPLAFASAGTGLVSALFSKWGLVRHYWVLSKIALSGLATAVLLTYTETVGVVGKLAAQPGVAVSDLRTPSFVLQSGVTLAALLVAIVVGVYKPRGLTPYGKRKRGAARAARAA